MGVVIGLLLYFLQLKNKQVNALKARIDLLATEKEADLLEVEIKKSLENKNLLAKEIQELNKSLEIVAAKREQIKADAKNLNPNQIEDYWNKN